MVFILFRKQNKDVWRVCTFNTFQREKLKTNKKIQVYTETEKTEELRIRSDTRPLPPQRFIQVNMTSKFNRMFSYENKGAPKVSHWASSVSDTYLYRVINLCFFYSHGTTEI